VRIRAAEFLPCFLPDLYLGLLFHGRERGPALAAREAGQNKGEFSFSTCNLLWWGFNRE
jgi:hypothetical protein